MSQARLPPSPADPGAVARIALPAQDEDIATLRRAVVAKLTYSVGKDPIVASRRDWFVAVALAVRDRIVERWLPSTRAIYAAGRKRVYYLSLEFLIGRLLLDSLNNLGLTEPMRAALAELGVDLEQLRALEPDAALGNGGLGRLAACFMESMATLGIPAYGYGIRYDHGLFRQVIKDGWQHEYPEDWLALRQPVGIRARRSALRRRLRRHGGGDHRRGRIDAPCLASGRDGRCGRLRHAGRRLARAPCEHAAAVVGARGRSAAARRLQPRRPRRRAGRNARARSDLADALSERRDAGRAGAAAAAGIFLRLRLAAGPGAPARAPAQAMSARCPTRRRSSSTTRIPRSRSPS